MFSTLSPFFVAVITLSAVALATLYIYYLYRISYWKKTMVLNQLIWHSNVLNEIIPKFIFPLKRDWWRLTPQLFNQAPQHSILTFLSLGATDVYVNDADMIRQLTVEQRKVVLKPTWVYDVLRFFGDNIVTTDGDEWHRHRMVCNPAFSDANNELVVDVTVKIAKSMFNYWDKSYSKELNGSPVHALDDLTSMTLGIISAAGFGYDLRQFDQDKDEQKHHQDQQQIMQFQESIEAMVKHNLVRLILPKIFFRLPIPFLRHVDRAYNSFEAHMRAIISKRHQERAQGTEQKQMTKTGKPRTDLLTLILDAQDNSDKQSKQVKNKKDKLSVVDDGEDYEPAQTQRQGFKLTDTEVFADSYMFMFAGHETTAHTLTFALGELALNPHIQQKLYEEVCEVLGDEDPKYINIDQLQYTFCVFMETLRLYPAVVVIPKYASETIKLGDVVVPKNTYIGLLVYALHRNAKYWDNPEEFRPERFDTRISPPIHKYAFIPFSMGTRSCIGKRFAQVEGIIALATIIKNYELLLPQGVTREYLMKFNSIITLTPVHGMNIIVRKRQQQKQQS